MTAEYQLIATGNGEKMEKFGKWFVKRPEPQATWQYTGTHPHWNNPDAHYARYTDPKGKWTKRDSMEEEWIIDFAELKFQLKLGESQNIGIFPEQMKNWDWMRKKIRISSRTINVLNLFAYTGGSSLACAKEEAKVSHVDANSSAIERMIRNRELLNLPENSIRYIREDVMTFLDREIRRGKKYDAIILDPPSFGRSKTGGKWQGSKELENLLEKCFLLLSDQPLFVVFSSHSTNLTKFTLEKIFTKSLEGRTKPIMHTDTLDLIEQETGKNLNCGITLRLEWR